MNISFKRINRDVLRMTPRKYWRLFLVSVVPLLLLGFAFGALVFPYPRHRYVLCNANYQQCNRWTNDYEQFEAVKTSVAKDDVGWFWISEGFVTGYLEDSIESKTTGIFNAQIVEAGGETLKSLVGKTVDISLGIPKNKRSEVAEVGTLLQCDRLEYLLQEAHFNTYCYGEGWNGPVEFTVPTNSGDFQLLQRLRFEIERVRSDRRWDFALYCLIVLPMFVYLFFAISGITWLTAKAFKFVRNG
ncbi:hypothetical protein HFN86_17110 [Rhizobium laguerreae]|uniref:hypothetical protein n=1 Tax=Rhizobium laguerreae TaxID=1076926 RepID=UPI001C8FF9A1|nr:hypothetical protein [Rhizobium laguerreae]MBY3421912.1 hypothetical protein [Rhizobium laguerreae]